MVPRRPDSDQVGTTVDACSRARLFWFPREGGGPGSLAKGSRPLDPRIRGGTAEMGALRGNYRWSPSDGYGGEGGGRRIRRPPPTVPEPPFLVPPRRRGPRVTGEALAASGPPLPRGNGKRLAHFGVTIDGARADGYGGEGQGQADQATTTDGPRTAVSGSPAKAGAQGHWRSARGFWTPASAGERQEIGALRGNYR